MRLPTIVGTIDRRILLNYRVDPEILAKILPPPFEPKLVGGFGLAGICLIRLRNVRPQRAPRWLGVASENAAHRIAVQWQDAGQLREGVYILRRDTNSRLNALAGGSLFPGVHHYAHFLVRESPTSFQIALESDDHQMAVELKAQVTAAWPDDSIFPSLGEASQFFEAGSLGYSPGKQPQQYDGLELRCRTWHAEPLEIHHARSSFFDNRSAFPIGSFALDCALLMRGIEHEWHSKGDLCCRQAPMAAGSPTACNSPMTSA